MIIIIRSEEKNSCNFNIINIIDTKYVIAITALCLNCLINKRGIFLINKLSKIKE